MVAYPDSWSGERRFYKGKKKKLPTAETDSGYKRYCKHERKQGREPKSYKKWIAKQLKTGSHMF